VPPFPEGNGGTGADSPTRANEVSEAARPNYPAKSNKNNNKKSNSKITSRIAVGRAVAAKLYL
jgi:hypothetical protein